MNLSELMNPSNIYRFAISNGEEFYGQLTREGKDFLQVGTQVGDRMSYRWINIAHVIHIEFLSTSFREAEKMMEAT